MMPHKGGGEVLRSACALTLGDEPLAGGVEYRALEVRVEQINPLCLSSFDKIQQNLTEWSQKRSR